MGAAGAVGAQVPLAGTAPPQRPLASAVSLSDHDSSSLLPLRQSHSDGLGIKRTVFGCGRPITSAMVPPPLLLVPRSFPTRAHTTGARTDKRQTTATETEERRFDHHVVSIPSRCFSILSLCITVSISSTNAHAHAHANTAPHARPRPPAPVRAPPALFLSLSLSLSLCFFLWRRGFFSFSFSPPSMILIETAIILDSHCSPALNK